MLLTCREMRMRIDDYCDGRLSPSESYAIQAHVARCGSCREQLATHQAVLALVRSATDVLPPPGYFDALPARLAECMARGSQRSNRVRFVVTLGAMASVATLLVGLLVQKFPPSASTGPLRKPTAVGLSLRFEGRRLLVTPEPTAKKPMPERIYRTDTSHEIVWVSLVQEAPRSEWHPSPPATPSPEPYTPEAWIALATLSSEGQAPWHSETNWSWKPEELPVEPTRRSEPRLSSARQASGLAAFVAAAPEVVSAPTFPLESSKRKRR